MSGEHEGIWLRLDEVENAIDNLESCAVFLERFVEPIRWKWAVIALHQAIYGFAVAAIQGSDSLSVLKNPGDHNSHLISFWEALERTRDRRFLWGDAQPLVLSDDEQHSIRRLGAEFRNGFEHFRPAAWSIEISGFPLKCSPT